jgi:hypothetical protein
VPGTSLEADATEVYRIYMDSNFMNIYNLEKKRWKTSDHENDGLHEN